MVKVTIYNNENNICIGFKANGHAGQDVHGQDIVCAAASMLMINTVNAIDNFAGDRYSLIEDDIEGNLEYQIKQKPSKEATILLKAMVQGLMAMEEDETYTKYIDIILEEV